MSNKKLPTTIRKMLEEKMLENNDSMDNVVYMHSNNTNGIELDKEFDNTAFSKIPGYPDSSDIEPFAVWTTEYVYFPVNGELTVQIYSVPRNPTDTIELDHMCC